MKWFRIQFLWFLIFYLLFCVQLLELWKWENYEIVSLTCRIVFQKQSGNLYFYNIFVVVLAFEDNAERKEDNAERKEKNAAFISFYKRWWKRLLWDQPISLFKLVWSLWWRPEQSYEWLLSLYFWSRVSSYWWRCFLWGSSFRKFLRSRLAESIRLGSFRSTRNRSNRLLSRA